MMGRKRKIKFTEGGDDDITATATPSRKLEIKRQRGTTPNPLLIDVVLDNLFQRLDHPSLDSARRVCKLWWNVSLPAWRSSGATLKLNYSMTKLKFDRRLRVSPSKLGSFLAFWKDQCPLDSPHLYRQYCLDDWIFDGVRSAEIHLFWQMVGWTMKKLTLVNCKAARPNAFFKEMIQSCPNLETLILEDCVFSDDDHYFNLRRLREAAAGFPYERPALGEHLHLKSLSVIKEDAPGLRLTCLELLSHFPHLSSFSGVPSDGEWQFNTDLDLLRAVARIREQDGSKLPLAQLYVEKPVDVGWTGAVLNYPDHIRRRDTMELAHSLNIPLTSIRLAKDMEDADEIKRVVQLHGPALVKLIAIMDSTHRPRCDFPFGVRLENLKELKISDGFCNILGFLKFTPNLGSLRIVGDVYGLVGGRREHGRATDLISNSSMQAMQDVRLPKLSNLHIQCIVTEEDVRHLVKWIPNVARLEMFLDDSQFPIVCQAWPNLLSLKVFGEALTDRGLTGIKYSTRSPVLKGKVLPPNITNLRALQVFDAPDAKLTDFSVTHGFMKICTALRHVCIRNTQITQAAKKTLHENYVKIDFGFFE